MGHKKHSIARHNSSKVLIVIGFSVLYIFLTVVQFVTDRNLICFVASLFQLLFTIIITVELYVTGFATVCSFSLIQTGLAVYSYISSQDDKYMQIIGFAAAAIVINMIISAYWGAALRTIEDIRSRMDKIRT